MTTTTSTALPAYTTGEVLSADGTIIGYRQLGKGPGLVLIHGGMQAAQNFMKLAAALAGGFTLYLPDRRGRGRSGTYGAGYTIQRDVDDVAALLDATGASQVFALSYGALIALRAAVRLPAIRQLALYEPPLSVQGSTPTAWVTRLDREVAAGNLAGGMVTILKGTEDTSLLRVIPRLLTEPLLARALAAEAGEVSGDRVPLAQLIPTMHYDAQLIREMQDTLEDYRRVTARTLLLGGSKSQKYLKVALEHLAGVLPNVERRTLPGLDHLAADNGGRPEVVAAELRRFFGAAQAA